MSASCPVGSSSCNAAHAEVERLRGGVEALADAHCLNDKPDEGDNMTTDDVIAKAAEVILWHWRTPTSGCHCGWGVLGASYSEHVAYALADAGLLTAPETKETTDD